MFTSHHITKLIADERVAQLHGEAAPRHRNAGERRVARLARHLRRADSTGRQPIAPRPSGLAPDSPEG